jgi:hypothetical protein
MIGCFEDRAIEEQTELVFDLGLANLSDERIATRNVNIILAMCIKTIHYGTCRKTKRIFVIAYISVAREQLTLHLGRL